MEKSIPPHVLVLLALLCFRGLSKAQDVSAPMDQKVKEALYATIAGFVGSSWNGSRLYADPCGWSQIQGVSCDLFDGLWYPTVVSIGPVLDNSLECSLDAKFSPQLFELKYLRSISIYKCFPVNHQTTIPSTSWDKLSGSLETLEFRSNAGLVGQIPSSIGRLSKLQSLVLSENGLVGELPQEIGNLAALKKLVLAGNGLSGLIPASIGGLNSLLKLDLSSNHLNGTIPAELGKLKNLTLLDLRNNSLSGGLAQGLQDLVSLQDLLLSNNPLGGTLMPSGWEKLANLNTLDLANSNLVGSIPESVSSIPSLRCLALDHNSLTGSVPPKLAALPNLNALYLNGNNLSGRLEFTEEFYEKMGSRFASWGNPNLCYTPVVDSGHVPVGVQECKDGQESPGDPRNGLYSKNIDEKSSVSSSASHAEDFWWMLLVQEVIAGFLLVMRL